jgi:hypothetical protein
MTDCFIRTSTNYKPLRAEMFDLVARRWSLEPVRIHVLRNLGILEGRLVAEEKAQSDPYIYTDDDVLIVGREWVKRAVEAMLSLPKYAVCSTLSLIEGENLAKGEGIIYPMHAVGHPMIIRTGILTGLPHMDLNNECGTIHKYVLDKGYEEGLISGLRHNHLGHGFSGSPQHFWGY